MHDELAILQANADVQSNNKRSWPIVGLIGTLILLVSNVCSAQTLQLLAYQNPFTLTPVVELFEQETGIQVEVSYLTGKQVLDALTARDKPADVVMTLEAKRLAALVDAKVLAPVTSNTLSEAVPAHFRHPKDLWFGISKWSRSVYYSPARVDPALITDYDSLTDERWRGRVCVRTSNKVYVQSLLASMIATNGEQSTRQFVQGLVKNFARQPVDLDMAQLTAVASGICDLTLANSYYYERLRDYQYHPLAPDAGKAARQLLSNVKPLAVGQGNQGAHMNISAMAMAQKAKNPELALKFMEFMVSPAAQRLLVERGREFPIVAGARSNASSELFGDFQESSLPLAELSQYYELAETITRESGWLWE